MNAVCTVRPPQPSMGGVHPPKHYMYTHTHMDLCMNNLLLSMSYISIITCMCVYVFVCVTNMCACLVCVHVCVTVHYPKYKVTMCPPCVTHAVHMIELDKMKPYNIKQPLN